MKKISLVLFTLLFQLSLHSQTDVYAKVKQLIQEKHPELNLSNKLIGFVIWTVNDEESRDLNKNFEKTVHVYENAKLKGGSKGIAIISINKENLTSEANITLQKDGIVTLISVKLQELEELDLNGLQNQLFDSVGTEIYRDLNSSNVYSSINKLITR